MCVVRILFGFFFFFKQKTAYEMRISDWSSDVCSSDLSNGGFRAPVARADRGGGKNDVDDEASLRGVRRAVVAGERRCGARGARRLRRSFSQHLSSRGIGAAGDRRRDRAARHGGGDRSRDAVERGWQARGGWYGEAGSRSAAVGGRPRAKDTDEEGAEGEE